MVNDAAGTAVPAQPTGVGRARVLVVDDSLTVRSYHRMILAAAGFPVREANNGYEALELALAERFDLLLVDVNMPVMDGYSLVEAVRREALAPDVPIIMISTEAAAVDLAEAYRRGANLYLVKPADPEQLVRSALLLTGRHPPLARLGVS